MAILRIKVIRCNTQEDTWGDDDIYIRVNGDRVWGPVSMDTNQTRVINVDVAFHSRVEIALYEDDDADDDDYLGTRELRRSDAGEHHLSFTGDGASYSLWVLVTDSRHAAHPQLETAANLLADAPAFFQRQSPRP